MLKKSLVLVCVLQSALLTCCLGGSDYYRDRVAPFLKELKPNYKPQMFDGVMEPTQFPDLEEDQKTLIGIDSNRDGVRDDMEIFINRNFKHDFERENLKIQFKRSIYFFNNYKKMTPDEIVIYDSNTSEDAQCIGYAYRNLKIKPSAEYLKYRAAEVLYNTNIRNGANNFNYQKLAGRAYGDGYGDVKIFEACKNKIDEKYRPKKSEVRNEAKEYK